MLMFNLEDAMKLVDINQAKLSALSDVRPNTISDLIKANTKRIEVDTLENLLDALNGIAKSKGIKSTFRFKILSNITMMIMKIMRKPTAT